MIFVIDNARDFGDNVSAALDLYPVIDLHTQPFDFIRVMQSGAADGGAANRYWLQHRDGSQFPGAPDLPENAFDLGDARPRSVFVSDRPPRSVPGIAKLLLQRSPIYLHNNSIDF